MARPIDPAKEQYWRRVFARWRARGLSIAAFCAEAGLTEANFYRWRRVLHEREGHSSPGQRRRATGLLQGNPTVAAGHAPLFVPLVVEGPVASAAVLEVVVGGGRVVRVPVGFDVPTLAQLLALLEGRPC